MTLYTIGSTKKSAREFFETLKENGVKTLFDIRLNNMSQLAGFTKKNDLEYFLKEICNIKYIYLDILAPTKDIMDDYKNKKIDREEFKRRYIELIESRKVLEKINKNLLDNACLLCSGAKAEDCHRSLASEYIAENYEGINVIHL